MVSSTLPGPRTEPSLTYWQTLRNRARNRGSSSGELVYSLSGVILPLYLHTHTHMHARMHARRNRALYSYMQRFGVECQKWLVRVMCGSVDIQTVYGGDKQAKACLFSRLSCERAGTRYIHSHPHTLTPSHTSPDSQLEAQTTTDMSVTSLRRKRPFSSTLALLRLSKSEEGSPYFGSNQESRSDTHTPHRDCLKINCCQMSSGYRKLYDLSLSSAD